MMEAKYTNQIMFVTQLVRWKDRTRKKNKIYEYDRYVLKVPPTVAKLLEPGEEYVVIIKPKENPKSESEEVRRKDERRRGVG